MSKDNNFFEEFAKLSGATMNQVMHSMSDMKKNWDEMVQNKIKEFLDEQNVVTREEFEVVKKMAEKSRKENQKLQKEISKLEEQILEHDHDKKTSGKKK